MKTINPEQLIRNGQRVRLTNEERTQIYEAVKTSMEGPGGWDDSGEGVSISYFQYSKKIPTALGIFFDNVGSVFSRAIVRVRSKF